MKIQNKKIIIILLAIPFLSNLTWYITDLGHYYSFIGLFTSHFLPALAVVSSIVLIPIALVLILNRRFYQPNFVSKQLKNGKKQHAKNTRG
jgi:hypothetical protein